MKSCWILTGSKILQNFRIEPRKISGNYSHSRLESDMTHISERCVSIKCFSLGFNFWNANYICNDACPLYGEEKCPAILKLFFFQKAKQCHAQFPTFGKLSLALGYVDKRKNRDLLLWARSTTYAERCTQGNIFRGFCDMTCNFHIIFKI